MTDAFEKREIRKGVAIVRQPSLTKFWSVRFWDNARKRYVVRTTKESGSVIAKKVAEELIAEYYTKGGVASDKPAPDRQFAYYAAQLLAQNKLDGSKWVQRDDAKLLNRKGGLLDHFGARDVVSLKTSDIRDFLNKLDEGRETPLSASSKTKFVNTFRKVMAFAKDAGVIVAVPESPKITLKQDPRPSFTEKEYLAFLKAARAAADRGDVVRGVKVTREIYHMIVFASGSFLRPTESELLALKHGDITRLKHNGVDYLELRVKGKTGFRVVPTLPVCAPIYAKQIRLIGENKASDYVFLPQYKNRTTALNTYRRLFNHILEKAGLRYDADGNARVPYSIRHFAIQRRLAKSGGQVNILWLAEAAGTSPEVIRKFYVAKMGMDPAKVANLHFTVPKGG